MNGSVLPSSWPRAARWLAVAYFLSSLAHFAHNAEYIASYPNLPGWLQREHVYGVWLAITAVGLASLVAARAGRPALSLLLLGVYGALGLDGLGHYALALCSQHTVIANLTVGAEAATGLALLLTASVLLVRRPSARS